MIQMPTKADAEKAALLGGEPTPTKKRHRWKPVKGLRAFWSSLRGVKSFICACGAHLHERKEGRLYSNFTGNFRQSILLKRNTPMPPCTRGDVR
jgi:hypothetical protein